MGADLRRYHRGPAQACATRFTEALAEVEQRIAEREKARALAYRISLPRNVSNSINA